MHHDGAASTASGNGTSPSVENREAKADRPPANGSSNGYGNGKGHGNGHGYSDGHNENAHGNGHANGKANGHTNGKANGNGNGYYRTVSINLQESSDADEDVQLLNDVKKLLLEYPGSDHVNLTIQTQQGQLRMEWPLVSTSYCEALQTSLDGLLGQGSVRVEDVRPNGN